MHHSGLIPRLSAGVVRYEMENIGRRLVHVDLDCGRSLVLLADDVTVDAHSEDGRPLEL